MQIVQQNRTKIMCVCDMGLGRALCCNTFAHSFIFFIIPREIVVIVSGAVCVCVCRFVPFEQITVSHKSPHRQCEQLLLLLCSLFFSLLVRLSLFHTFISLFLYSFSQSFILLLCCFINISQIDRIIIMQSFQSSFFSRRAQNSSTRELIGAHCTHSTIWFRWQRHFLHTLFELWAQFPFDFISLYFFAVEIDFYPTNIELLIILFRCDIRSKASIYTNDDSLSLRFWNNSTISGLFSQKITETFMNA